MAARLLPKFRPDFSNKEWVSWKSLVKRFIVTQRARTPDEKLAHLVLQGGEELDNLLETLPHRNPVGVGLSVSLIQNDEFELALQKLDDHFEAKTTTFATSTAFKDLKQNTGESAKMFSIRVREMARRCNFANEEQEIINQLIRGLRGNEIKQKAHYHQYESVEEVVNEAFAKESKVCATSEHDEINMIAENATCYFCKTKGHISRICPKLKDIICKRCKKKGHTQAYCREKVIGRWSGRRHERGAHATRTIHFVEESQGENSTHGGNSDTEYIMHLDATKTVFANIGGVKQDFVVDTGVKSNIIPSTVWRLLKEKGIKVKNQSTDCNKIFMAFGAECPLVVLGMFEARLKVGNTTDYEKFYVLEKGERCLLGLDTCTKLKIVTFNTTHVRP